MKTEESFSCPVGKKVKLDYVTVDSVKIICIRVSVRVQTFKRKSSFYSDLTQMSITFNLEYHPPPCASLPSLPKIPPSLQVSCKADHYRIDCYAARSLKYIRVFSAPAHSCGVNPLVLFISTPVSPSRGVFSILGFPS